MCCGFVVRQGQHPAPGGGHDGSGAGTARHTKPGYRRERAPAQRGIPGAGEGGHRGGTEQAACAVACHYHQPPSAAPQLQACRPLSAHCRAQPHTARHFVEPPGARFHAVLAQIPAADRPAVSLLPLPLLLLLLWLQISLYDLHRVMGPAAGGAVEPMMTFQDHRNLVTCLAPLGPSNPGVFVSGERRSSQCWC